MSIGKSDRNITPKVIGVLFALVLWFNVTTNATFTYQIEVPIQYAGLADGYMVSGDRPDHITATIEGTGKELLAYNTTQMFTAGQRYALVDLTDMTRGQHQITIEPGQINLAVDSNIRITGISYPENAEFSLYIDRVVSRTVQVRTDSLGVIDTAAGIMPVGDPAAVPPQVDLTGAQEVVNRVRYILPEKIGNRRITRADTVLAVELVAPEYTSAEPPVVNLRFKLDEIVNRRLQKVPVRLRNFPRNSSLHAAPDSITVEVRGAASVVSGLESATFRVEIGYDSYQDQITAGDSLIAPSAVLPEGILDAGFIPARIRLVPGS